MLNCLNSKSKKKEEVNNIRCDVYKYFNIYYTESIDLDSLLNIYEKLVNELELKVNLKQIQYFQHNTNGIELDGRISQRQLTVWTAFNYHILNKNIKEANHSMFEFIENYHFNLTESLNNIEKIILYQMIEMLKLSIEEAKKEEN